MIHALTKTVKKIHHLNLEKNSCFNRSNPSFKSSSEKTVSFNESGDPRFYQPSPCSISSIEHNILDNQPGPSSISSIEHYQPGPSSIGSIEHYQPGPSSISSIEHYQPGPSSIGSIEHYQLDNQLGPSSNSSIKHYQLDNQPGPSSNISIKHHQLDNQPGPSSISNLDNPNFSAVVNFETNQPECDRGAQKEKENSTEKIKVRIQIRNLYNKTRHLYMYIFSL